MKTLADFKQFQNLCLSNAEAAMVSAEQLKNTGANHIAYHLCTLALEELGKIHIGWMNFNRSQEPEEQHGQIVLDDHIKKIFWAIWWETFGKEIPDQQQMDANKALASKIHARRLFSLYTATEDTVTGNEKIPDGELENMLVLVRAKLEIAKMNEIGEKEPSAEINEFLTLSDDPEKRKFIFGEEAQNKLIQCADMREWVKWLLDKFKQEQEDMTKLLNEELEKPITMPSENAKAKWRIKIKVTSALHSVRQNTLNDYNKKSDMFKLNKGANNQTLIIDVNLDDNTNIQALWHYGYLVSRIFVTALNIGTNGVFWWHANTDPDKYYESIKDVTSNKGVEASLVTKLKWPKTNMVLEITELHLCSIVNSYMVKCYSTAKFEPFYHYMTATSMLAKNDIHLRFEMQMFDMLFTTYRRTIISNEHCEENDFALAERLKNAPSKQLAEEEFKKEILEVVAYNDDAASDSPENKERYWNKYRKVTYGFAIKGQAVTLQYLGYLVLKYMVSRPEGEEIIEKISNFPDVTRLIESFAEGAAAALFVHSNIKTKHTPQPAGTALFKPDYDPQHYLNLLKGPTFKVLNDKGEYIYGPRKKSFITAFFDILQTNSITNFHPASALALLINQHIPGLNITPRTLQNTNAKANQMKAYFQSQLDSL